MNKVVWLLVIIFLSDILFDWYSNNQKQEALQQIQAINEELHRDIDSINLSLDQIKNEMKDDEAWTKASQSLNNNFNK